MHAPATAATRERSAMTTSTQAPANAGNASCPSARSLEIGANEIASSTPPRKTVISNRAPAPRKGRGDQREQRDREHGPPGARRRVVGPSRGDAPNDQRRGRSDERQQFVARRIDAGNAPLGVPNRSPVGIDAGIACEAGGPVGLKVACERAGRWYGPRSQHGDRDRDASRDQQPSPRYHAVVVAAPGVAIRCACAMTKKRPSRVARYHTLTRRRAANVMCWARGST